MRCLTITYEYTGDEDAWRHAIDTFVSAIRGHDALKGRFTYQVAVADDGVSRIHWAKWDSEETLATMQGSAYFKTFAAKIKEFAGDSLKTVGANVVTTSVDEPG